MAPIRRGNNPTHSLYRVAAGILGTVSIYVWAGIRADVKHRVGLPLTAYHAATLATSVVLGISVVTATLTWLIVFHVDRRAREADELHAYYEARQERSTRPAVDVFLAEGEATTKVTPVGLRDGNKASAAGQERRRPNEPGIRAS